MLSNKLSEKSLHTPGVFSALASRSLLWSYFCGAFLPFLHYIWAKFTPGEK